MTVVQETGNTTRERKIEGRPTPVLRAPRKARWPWAAVAAVAALGGGVWVAGYFLGGRSADASAPLTYTATIDSFDVRIPLNGEMKANRNLEIRNQVEGQTTILSLVPEGTRVNEGDVLVTLASDAIKDKLEESRIRLDNAVAATVNSQESVRIQEMQNESDIKTAETDAELARLAYEQFDKGDSKTQLDTLTTALENANTDLERKVKDLARVKELAVKQFVSDNDVLDAVIAERDSRNKLATAEMNLKVWKQYTEPMQRQTLQRKMDQTAADLERTKAKANANLLLKQADLRAKQSTQHVEETRYKGFQEQLAACTIKAPQAGLVVYQTSVGGWQNQGPIEEGATVRQNQVLIQLPDTTKMQVEVRLAEQLTDQVKKGQEAVVTVDAVPGKVFHGKVDGIAVLPDSSNRWANPNLKEYPTTILLDGLDPALKPGMSAKAEILVDRLDNVLAVPLQAVFTSGGEAYVFVGDNQHYERRSVVTGERSSIKVEIKEGLKAGEVVLLSRPKDAPADQPDSQRDKKDASSGKAGEAKGEGANAHGGGRA
jgi:HlyD family secretion protein